MFISIYFKTSSCDSDPEINTFIYGPPPSINFCARLFSMMDRLWLDTCKQSSTALSSSLFAFCVAVQWEVTGHSNPTLATAHHPKAFPGSLLSCTPFLLRLSPPCSAHDWQLYGSDSWQTKPTANGRLRDAHAEQMQMALSSAMSFNSFHAMLSVSPVLPYLSAVMYNLIPVKYSCCAHEDMMWRPFDRTAKLFSDQHDQSDWEHRLGLAREPFSLVTSFLVKLKVEERQEILYYLKSMHEPAVLHKQPFASQGFINQFPLPLSFTSISEVRVHRAEYRAAIIRVCGDKTSSARTWNSIDIHEHSRI